jgi:hypothetical protein
MNGRGKGQRKRLRATEQITSNNTKQIKVLELVHGEVLSGDGRKLPEEADTQTDAVTPGRGIQAGWLNLPQKDLNPFPPVEPVTLPSLMATRRCRAATDIG